MRCVLTVPKPPTHLVRPNICTLHAGTHLQRVHRRGYRADCFNPCKGNPTRFAPIRDAKGDCVPSLYAADTLQAAIYEAIFHDIPLHVPRKTVPRIQVEVRAHSDIEVMRDLQLASLRQPDLLRWNISRDSLIATPTDLYGDTAQWAKAIHHQFPDVNGLLWTSNQCDPDTAYLFFGDRVASADFRIVQIRDGTTDSTFLADVHKAGSRSGIRIVI